MVQGKREVVSFKTKKRRQIDPDEWIVVESTHEPVISRELWDKVHERLESNRHVRKTKKQTVGLFAGILKCGDCGSSLAYMRKNLKQGEKGVYRCSRYNNNGGKACSTHYIEENDICAFVINDIKEHAKLVNGERERLADRLVDLFLNNKHGEEDIIRSKIREAENRLTVITGTLTSLYEDKCTGKLPENVFQNMMSAFVKEQSEIEGQLPFLRQQFDEIRETTGEIESWLSLIGNYIELEVLDRITVTELIETITVSERVRKNGKQTQKLEIQYRFIGNLLQDMKEDIA
jgi:hypothetical protein